MKPFAANAIAKGRFGFEDEHRKPVLPRCDRDRGSGDSPSDDDDVVDHPS
jgi:hypothetical protein